MYLIRTFVSGDLENKQNKNIYVLFITMVSTMAFLDYLQDISTQEPPFNIHLHLLSFPHA